MTWPSTRLLPRVSPACVQTCPESETHSVFGQSTMFLDSSPGCGVLPYIELKSAFLRVINLLVLALSPRKFGRR